MAQRIYVTTAHGSIEPLEETAFAAEDEPLIADGHVSPIARSGY